MRTTCLPTSGLQALRFFGAGFSMGLSERRKEKEGKETGVQELVHHKAAPDLGGRKAADPGPVWIEMTRSQEHIWLPTC